MKKRIVWLAMLGGFYLSAQQCESLMFTEGTQLTYTQFDKKGQENGKSTHHTTQIEKVNDKITATLEMKFQGQKKDENFTTAYKVSCADGVIGIDMVRFFDASSMLNYDSADFSVDIEGSILEFPEDLNESAILNDGNIQVKVKTGNVPIMTMTLNITNRKTEGTETITTPAGTFECTKISYDYESKAGFIKIKGRAEEWYANDQKLVVQSISYNKKGKEVGSSQLTAKN